jgi:PAS domain S-box-containing protein
MKNTHHKSKVDLLRQKVEEQLKLNEDKEGSLQAMETEMLRLIHELEVHQIELELQKDELSRAKLQEALDKEKYTNLFDFAPSAYFNLTADGTITELNLAGAKMLGRDRGSLIHKSFTRFITRNSLKTFTGFLSKTFISKNPQNCEVSLNAIGNKALYVHISGNLSDDGKYSLIIAVDITERINAELALQNSELKFRQLAESSPSIVYRLLLKPELKFDYVSPSVTAITGYTPEDHYNDPQLGFKLVHPDDRILLENTTRYSKGEPLELRWIRKDGKVIWTEQRNVLLFDENNEVYALEGNARDINDRKNMELGLRKEAERNALLLDLFAKASVLTDYELFNQALDIAVTITDSKIGFFHQVSDNQQEIILTTWNDEAKKNCNTPYKNHYPIEKAGNWADCIRLKKAVIYNDYPTSPNKKGLPEGHSPVGRTMSVPVINEGKVRLIFGVGNKSSDYTDSDVVQIQAIANEMHKILEKRKVDHTLQKSEDRWQFAIEGSNDGIWDWNMLTGEVFFSNRWKEMIGFKPDELEGNISVWQTRVHPDDIESVMFRLNQHFSQETPDYTSEHRVLCKDESWKWILDRGKVLEWTSDGKPVRMVGTHTDITDRKKTEEVIRNSEEKFRIVADNAYNWEFWEGADGNWIHHSPSCKKITGYSADEFLNDNELLLEIIHPDDRLEYIAHHRETRENQTHGYHTFRIITREGQTRDIEHVCQAVFNDENTYIGIRGSNIDITERKSAEKQLREREVQYRNLANAGSALIWTSGTDKLCNYFNETWLKFTGRSLEQEMGNGWAEGVHPDDFDRCVETYVAAFDKQEPFEMEYRLCHSSGEYRWIMDLGTPNFDSNGEFVGYIGHCFDISERKLAEVSLHESEEKYRSIFESVQEVYFEASMDGTLLEVSPSIEKITKGQFTRNEMIGQSFAGIYASAGDRDIYFSKLFEQKRVNDYELSLKNKDGSIIPVAISSVLSYDASGKPVKITGILRDITERKIAENALKDTLEQLNHANQHLEKRVEERTREIMELSGLQNAILANAPLAIMTTDKDGLFQSINPATEKMLGYAAKEIVGVLKPLVFHDKDEIVKLCIEENAHSNPTEEEIFGTLLKFMFHKTTEWTWIRKNGEKFPVRIIHSSIIDDNGTLQGYMALVIDITQEKLAIETLHKSEAENRAIIQAVPDLMFRINRDGTYLDSHSQNESSLYIPKEIFVSKKISEVLPPDLAEQSMHAVEKAFATGEVVQYEYMLAVQENDRYFENRVIAISDNEVLAIIRDITDKKNAENELQEAIRKLSTLIQNLQAGTLFENESRHITLVNQSFCNLFNIQATPEQLEGYDCVLASEESKRMMKDPEGFIRHIDEILLKGEIVVNDELNLLDGRVLERDYIPIKNNDILLGHLWQYRDITKRKASEIALKMQSAAFESFALTIIITDVAGRIQWVNSAFTRLTGYSVDEAIGKTLGELIKSDKQDKDFYAKFWETILNKKVWSGELINRRKDGSLYYEEETITPVLDSQGNISSFIAIKIDITERKMLYQELANEKRRLADIIKGTNVGTWEWNIQTGEVIFNEQWAEILGYTLDEISPVSIETWMKFAHPDDLKKSGELLEKHFTGKLGYYSFESRMQHKNGEWIWVLDRGRVHEWDNEGKPLLMSGTHQDITEQKRAAMALLESDRKLGSMITNISDVIGIMSADGIMQYKSPNIEKYFGWKPDDLIGTNGWLTIHPDDLERIQLEFFDILQKENASKTVEYKYKCKDGSYKPIELTATNLINDEVIHGVLLNYHDITERRRIIDALKESENRFSLFMDYLPAIVFLKDHEGRTLFVNKYLDDTFHASAWIGKTMLEVFPNELGEKILADDMKSIALGYDKYEETIADASGKQHNYETQKFVIPRSGHEPLLGGISLDITSRKQSELALIKAKNEAEKANHAKSEFLSRMSHELRTPLNSILGFAQLMEMGVLSPKQKKGVNHILSSGRHLLSLINEVLNISGIEAGKQMLMSEPVQLVGLIHEIIDSIQVAANKRNLTIEFADSPANSLYVLADSVRLKQVLINLINNAIKYNNEGGKVTIVTSLQPTNDHGNTFLRISISDNGNGINPEDISKLFQAFERIGADKTGVEGTGLGLMVVKKLTEAMGGNVGVDSEPGIGSTFWIELPLTRNRKHVTKKSFVSSTRGLGKTKQGETILYIEDNHSNIELVEDILASHHPEINLVTSNYGKQTIELARIHKPLLILLDLDLPDIQGDEVLDELLEDTFTKSIPVIIVSANAMPFQVEKLMQAGALDYLTKPLDVIRFLNAIDQYIKM